MNKILLIEDDDLLGIVLNDQLEMYGYEVSLLSLPRRAIEYLQEASYDLVIMDKLLNGIDGAQICTEIRNTAGISDIPVLMMSGLDGARQMCTAAGASAFIAKPFEIPVLLRSIETCLGTACGDRA